MNLETLPAGIDAAFLTQALRLPGGARVREVEVQDARNTILSRIIRLRLHYDGPAADAPQTLVLKTRIPGPPQTGWNGGLQEADFYRKVAAATPAGLLPRCFDAQAAADGSEWHLLLEDLAGTHRIVTPWPLPPGVEEATRIVEARARFHAAWWDHPQLGVSVGKWAARSDLDGILERFGPKFARFAERLGDVLTPERRALYERLLADAHRLNERYHSRRHLTIIQGDGHFWNCFLANDGGGVKFFDWDCWGIDAGADDLAYMIAMHWYPDRRRRFESGLLDRYHDTLLAHGVTGYDRQALQEDYRLAVLWRAMTPVWQAGIDLPPVIWWNNYERIMMAVDDLGCRDLLA